MNPPAQNVIQPRDASRGTSGWLRLTRLNSHGDLPLGGPTRSSAALILRVTGQAIKGPVPFDAHPLGAKALIYSPKLGGAKGARFWCWDLQSSGAIFVTRGAKQRHDGSRSRQPRTHLAGRNGED